MAAPDNYDWESHDKVVASARARYDQYAKGRREKAPGAFRALDMVFNHLPDVNPIASMLVLGWIVGAITDAERNGERYPEADYDPEAEAWYIHVSDKEVHQTTEVVTNVDWTRDGELVGVELLPGAPQALVFKDAIPQEVLEEFRQRIEESLKSPTDVIKLSPTASMNESCPTCWPRPCDATRLYCKRRKEE